MFVESFLLRDHGKMGARLALVFAILCIHTIFMVILNFLTICLFHSTSHNIKVPRQRQLKYPKE